jgi:DNA-binding beta-propeller fold protein YncE/mono/diheme cytochrome c family protein
MRSRRAWIGAICGLCLSLSLIGCTEELSSPPLAAMGPAYPGLPIGPAAPPEDFGLHTTVRSIPTDERPVTTVDMLPPVSGGTLAVTPDDRYAIAADPDRDRVSIVDLTAHSLVFTIPLNAGDEPGRVVIDDAGRAHVALRRGAAVASIEIATGKLLERREVCAAPRGIEYDASRKRLLVACQGGELVSLPASGTHSITRQSIAPDLRDVIRTAHGVFVSRFKSAELVALDPNGTVRATAQPAIIPNRFAEVDGSESIDVLDPLGARRVRLASDDTAVMLHQTARASEITLELENEVVTPASAERTPYGDGRRRTCTGAAGVAITTFDSAGNFVNTVPLATMGALPVDLAVSPKEREIAIALAGATDPGQPIVRIAEVGFHAASGGSPAPPQPNTIVFSVLRYDAINFSASAAQVPAQAGRPPCVTPSNGLLLSAPATAVAFTSDDQLLVQTREPASLQIATRGGAIRAPEYQIDLGGASVLDTGHEIFHRDAGAGIACATCHLEGAEDGHTWHFADQGPRRTQDLSVGLEATAPFHWVGDMLDLGALMENVFVQRMGGVHESQPRLDALARWIFSIRPPAPLRAADDPAVAHGRELFNGAADCTKCHVGPKLTNNETVDVGTGLALQVPSLIGVGLRGPWLHDGCAKTLQMRFDPACGGAAHGPAGLTAKQRNDLVAYLESL